jgi:membrane-associated phospholipid phosphatase
LIWLVLSIFALALYFPINRLTPAGSPTALPIDKLTPFYPPSVIPYLLGSVLMIVFPVWAAIKAKTGDYEAYTISLFFAAFISYTIFIVLPTYIKRPEINSTDVFSKILLSVYHADNPHNVAPSGHTFYTLISLFYLSRWRPKFKLIWISVTIVIILSTLLTHQHDIIDVAGGIILALLAYFTGINIQKKYHLASGSQYR